MENKPFDLQSPIKIASEYGGNKQKIAQASKMGLVDPTAALLAGMFIDRMRSAQQAEMTPQQTVADKVFSPQPPPPPPGAMPQGGPPRGGPPMPMGGPPMPMGGASMPPPPQGGPPMGMASGGLMSIPVPDAMFDEPDNGGYANGGMVAFASAGDVRLKRLKQQYNDAVKNKASAETVNNLANQINNFQQDEGAAPGKGIDLAGIPQTPYFNRLAGAPQVRDALGALGKFASNYNDNPYGVKAPAVDATTPATAPAAASAAAPAAAPAVIPTAPRTTAAVVAPQMGRRNPNATAAPIAAAAPAATPAAAPAAAAAPVAPVAPIPKAQTPLEAMQQIKELSGTSDTEDKAYLEERKKRISPEAQAADKKQAMWEALAQFGLNLASNKSPSLLQAVAEAGNATLPSLQAAEKERKAELKDTLKEIREDERYNNTEKRQLAASAISQSNQSEANLRADKAAELEAKKVSNQEKQFGQEMDLKRDEIASRERISTNQINATLKAAAIAAGADRSTVGDRAAIAWAEAARAAGDTRPYVQLLNGGYSEVASRAQTPTNPALQNLLGGGTGGARPAAGGKGRPSLNSFNG